jgi:hypothetical protein
METTEVHEPSQKASAGSHIATAAAAAVAAQPRQPMEKTEVQEPSQKASAGSHIANMLRMRQQQKVQTVADQVTSVPDRVAEKPQEVKAAVPTPTPIKKPSVPLAPVQPKSTPAQPKAEIPLPPALAQIKAPTVDVKPTVGKKEEKASVAVKVVKSLPVVEKAPEPVAPTLPPPTMLAYSPKSSPPASRGPAAQQMTMAGIAEKTSVTPAPRAKATPAPVVPEAKPEPVVQKQEKVTELTNGKQVMDETTTVTNADGTQKRERKRKTKNSDKKSKPVDEGVDHHCACVVM